jgi:hypothetical protein
MFTLDEEVEEDYILNIPSVLFDLIQYSIYNCSFEKNDIDLSNNIMDC